MRSSARPGSLVSLYWIPTPSRNALTACATVIGERWMSELIPLCPSQFLHARRAKPSYGFRIRTAATRACRNRYSTVATGSTLQVSGTWKDSSPLTSERCSLCDRGTRVSAPRAFRTRRSDPSCLALERLDGSMSSSRAAG